MSVLVPWPAPRPTGAVSKSGSVDAALDFASKRVAKWSAEEHNMFDVTHILGAIKSELEVIQPLKDRVQNDLLQAMAQSSSKSLCGCRLETVGSSSWGGDVPHSDLDMVLVTPSQDATGSQAIAALRALRSSVEDLAWWRPCDGWHRLELLDMARIPILRIHCNGGLHCDVSVDQHQSLAHRNFLRKLLADRPQSSDFVRLVKLWLHRRGFPSAAQGGLPSLAWALMAIRFAQSRPKGTSVEKLFRDFFQEMRHLGEYSLCLRSHKTSFGGRPTYFEWCSRKGLAAWAEEWVQLLSVEDPCRLATITPPSMPAALGLLLVADLRLTWYAITEGRWSDVWRSPAHVAPCLNKLTDDHKLHVIMKDGRLCAGFMRNVEYCTGLRHSGVLHHRDQSSQLFLLRCAVQEGRVCNAYAHQCIDAVNVVCHPCHWVCALSLSPRMVITKDDLLKLAELIRAVGTMFVDPDLFGAVSFDTLAHACMAQLPATLDSGVHKSGDRGQVSSETIMTRSGCHSCREVASLGETDKGNDGVGRMAYGNGSHGGMDRGDDSTHASDSEGESQATFGQGSDVSEAVQCATDFTVDDAGAYAHSTHYCRQNAWKPTLRHPIFAPASSLTAAPTVTDQKTLTVEHTPCNAGTSEARIEKAPGMNNARKRMAARCQPELVWQPTLNNLNTSPVVTPIDDVGSCSDTPRDQNRTEEQPVPDYENEASALPVTEQKDTRVTKGHVWGQADATSSKRTFADVVKGKHCFDQEDNSTSTS